MSNLLFPSLPGISIERPRAPVWKSTVQESVSGKVVAITAQTYPRWKYKLSFEFLRAGAHAELQQIVGLFNQMRGRVDTFLFMDEDDCTATAQQIGLGDGVTTTFQLVRAFGGFIEPVGNIQAITSLTVGGVVQGQSLADAIDETLSLDFLTGTYSAWQNDYAYVGNGRITFTTPPPAGAPILWSGTFYWRCRFDLDLLDTERFLWQLWKAKSVEFTTEKI